MMRVFKRNTLWRPPYTKINWGEVMAKAKRRREEKKKKERMSFEF